MPREYNTNISKVIEEYIDMQTDISFSAADVYSYMQENGISVNLATVYRNLDKLTDRKILIKFKAVNSDNYLYHTAKSDCNCHRHLHIRCRKCGKIVHLDNNLMNEMIARLNEQYHFVLECENSSLCGLCEECI